MNKTEFIAALRQRLAYLPPEEVNGPVGFYAECIDERLEDGMTEAEAVAALGSVEEVARNIEADLPLSTLVKQRVKEKKERSGGTRALWIVLAIVGFPVWLPLLIAGLAVLFSVYVVIWAVIVSLWAVELALAAAAVGAAGLGAVKLFRGEGPQGLMLLGGGLALAGLALFFFFVCKAASKGAVVLTKKIALWFKSLFIKPTG